jgi:hypothetical protein
MTSLASRLLVALLWLSTGSTALAQGVTAHISGVVIDSDGGVVPGATVTITNAATNWHRDVVTDAEGRFVFVDVLAATYGVSATRDGFKRVERKDLAVASGDRAELPALVLEAGGIEETISVQGGADLVQTTTAARSARIPQLTFEDIALKGRDAIGMLKLLPGVVDINAREAPSWNLLSGLVINGRNSLSLGLGYDGINNKDTAGGNLAAPSVESIGEIRVQSANFQAEYGRSSGASITVITRSGSKDFHGSAAFYKRDTALNGNEYLRKQQCGQGDGPSCQPALYRFDNVAWTLGGPVLVPSTAFNRQRDRLFFFWSQERLVRTDPGTLNLRRMPTERERAGDFSQTLDSAGDRVWIRDAEKPGSCNVRTGGTGCFTDNIIPANRIDPTGQALLRLFPLPNATDPSGQYNYTYQMVTNWPRNDQVLRVDWNAGPRTTVYGRLQFGYENRGGAVAPFGFTAGWPQMASNFETESVSYVTTLLHTISPTTFLEATAGVNRGHQWASPFNQAALDANNRAKVLPGMPQFFPEANPLDLLPNATFNGGIPPTGGTASIGLFQYERRFPFYGYTTLWNFSGSVTKVLKAHNIKTGIFVEHSQRPAQQRSAYNGTFSFNRDVGHARDTNVGFANALLGVVTSFQQADKRPIGHSQFVNTEFYTQDNWRVGKRLTIDAGVRFYYLTPIRSEGDQVAQFEPELFDPTVAPLLYVPTTVGTARRALNPVTGDTPLAVYIGRPIRGTGDFSDGTQLYDGTPQRRSPFEIAPRLGLAWNVTGDGRTAIRGGAGAFYDRYQDNDVLELTELPPLVRTDTVNYTTIAELTKTERTETTSAMRRIQEFVPSVVYNWSAGVQRDVGWSLVVDAAYVGNAARRQPILRELNGRPYGYRFQPSSLDPTNPINGVTQPLPDDLLRPYRGYASISQREFTGYADYHSLQVSATRRRRADGLTFGAAYTYEIVNKTLGAVDPFLADNRARNYNSVGRRPHTLNLHYSWLVPGAGRSSAGWLRAIANDWQLSGVTSFLSGAQGAFTYSYSSVPAGALIDNGSIGGGPNRPRILCDPELPRFLRTFERQFQTQCIAAPDDPYNFGTARGDEFHGPGYVNWDISVFKHIPMGGSRRLQLRAELYNAFDTYQWTAVNTNAEFNFTTGALTNPNVFGRLTGATNSARRIQLAARFTF